MLLLRPFSVPALALVAMTVGQPLAEIPGNVTFRNFFGDGVSFERPVQLVEIPSQDSVFLVVQQSGAIYRMWHDGNAWNKNLFDSLLVTGINGILNPRGPDEGSPSGLTDDGGLMGMAFHPDYPEDRRYYVKYVDPAYPGGTVYPGTIVIAERTTNLSRSAASNDPQRVVLALPKPFVWHSGGTLRFGDDGFLYTAIGDGGSAGDPQNRAQNPATLHGKMLRIDIEGPDAYPEDTTRNYAIPPDNPFVEESGFLPETWALGLRSPWRWDFHPETGEIWLGDVGQATREKVTRVPRGGNLGWKIWEGFYCFSGPCSWDGFVEPVLDLPNTLARSVTGGTFFSGDTSGAFHGLYIYGDFVNNHVWALREADGVLVDSLRIGTVANVVSFDKDARGNIFAISISSATNSYSITGNNGAVYILESPDMILAPEEDPTRIARAGRSHAGHGTPILWSDVRRNPSRFEIRGLDGRVMHGPPTGVVWVRPKTPNASPQLMLAPESY